MATTDTTTEETKEVPKKKATTTRAPRAPRKPKETAAVKEEKEVVATEEAEAAEAPSKSPKNGSYISAVGRRKTAIARVRLVKAGKGTITINKWPTKKYFATFELDNIVKAPLSVVGLETGADISVIVQGGGLHAQAEAVRLGIARALIELNPTYRKTLKKLGYLTRDPRAKERKKPGLKRARRAPQWSKR